MGNVESVIAIASGILAIAGVLVGLTRHLTKVQEQAARDEIAAQNREMTAKVEALEEREAQLKARLAEVGKVGSAALSQKCLLDEKLQALMQLTGATGGSIYVPVRSPHGDIHGLAFLCVEPFKPQTQALRSKIIPLKSLAGRCFTSGKSFVIRNAGESPDRFKAAEKLSEYRPSTMLNIALAFEGELIGVLQLLSGKGEAGFGEDDLTTVEAMLGPIPEAVAQIARAPDSLRVLGLAENEQATDGSVLYLDLSRSSLLFQELSSSFALQLLNEYFERMCEVAFRLGGTLDGYTGDGALLRFNVPRPTPDHELAAVTAAVEMNRAFLELKEYWVAISARLDSVYNRIGIATGPLLRANLGHSQVQSLTIIGYPVSVAAALCESADRDRNVVVIAEETWAVVQDRVIAAYVDERLLGKAQPFTKAAYEVTGLR